MNSPPTLTSTASARAEETELSFGQVAVRSPSGSDDYTYGSPHDDATAAGDMFHLFCLAKPMAILAALDAAERSGCGADERVGAASTTFAPTRLADASLADAFSHGTTLAAPKIDDIILRQPAWLTDWRTDVQMLQAATGYTDWCSAALAIDVIETAVGISAAEVLNNLCDRLELDILWGNADTIHHTRRLSYVEYSAARSPLPLHGFWTPELGNLLADPTVTAIGNVASIAEWFHMLGEFVFHDGSRPPGVPECARALATVPLQLGSTRRWSLGVATGLDAHAIGGLDPASIGHVGWMGRSFAAYDPSSQMAIAAVTPGYDARRLEAIEPHRTTTIANAIRHVAALDG